MGEKYIYCKNKNESGMGKIKERGVCGQGFKLTIKKKSDDERGWRYH